MDRNRHMATRAIGPRTARPVVPIRNQADEFLYQARNPRRATPAAETSASTRRLASALEGMLRYALPHIDDDTTPTVRLDVHEAASGAQALTLTLPAQLVDLLVLAVAAVGEQYRVTPVVERPRLVALSGGAQ